ncbi:L,D-transpeptidase family protein [Phenylobacterium aquaticum]|uniref:L,D-transpeptidase family protein n=1 Tax=Phenylobacterium aquaticum TaxID=1763816 RepID=UPI001F5C40E4|nr:L,D-transpeptidase family protein [Phenylobacterium aquaticum]MCI3133170.1 L,D-transpeptidase family protein [Phenylobacterium aquaticum]
MNRLSGAMLALGLALAVGARAQAPVAPAIPPDLSQTPPVLSQTATVRPAEINRLWALVPPEGAVLDPNDPATLALRAAAQRYAGMSWSSLPPGRALRLGASGPAVLALRERLQAEGYGPAIAPADPNLFDADLAAALASYQFRHGLEPDGVLGKAVRAELDIPPAARVAQIEANLERARWLPAVMPADRLEVDIASAEAVLYQGGQASLTMRVVVGDTKHETPIFASALETVVINPPWNVPLSITKAELMPREAREPGYLAKHDFVWANGRLVQAPGPENSLGQVKFDLDSPFGVYLHDTPAKSAFARPRRALSHGCMRLEKPRELAVALLKAQGWDDAAIAAAIAKGDTRRVDLDQHLPLFVVYRTVVPDVMGGVLFRPDVYGWDAELAAWLEGRTP